MADLVYGYYNDPAGGGVSVGSGPYHGGGTNVSLAIGAFTDASGLPDQINSAQDWAAYANALMLKTGPVSNVGLDVDVDADKFLAIGGSGADHVRSVTSSSATMLGGAGNDTLLSGYGADTLNGGSGHDSLVAGNNDDSLRGGSGNDWLDGGQGADRLNGDAGADTLVGGDGVDKLSGGVGADTFRFTSVGESQLRAMDRISDFSADEQDQIDLSAVDANANTTDNDVFVVVKHFGGHAGELVLKYVDAGGYTLVSGDVDGNGATDLMIRVNGHVAATDLVL